MICSRSARDKRSSRVATDQNLERNETGLSAQANTVEAYFRSAQRGTVIFHIFERRGQAARRLSTWVRLHSNKIAIVVYTYQVVRECAQSSPRTQHRLTSTYSPTQINVYANLVVGLGVEYPPLAARFAEWLGVFALDLFSFVPLEASEHAEGGATGFAEPCVCVPTQCMYHGASFYAGLIVKVRIAPSILVARRNRTFRHPQTPRTDDRPAHHDHSLSLRHAMARGDTGWLIPGERIHPCSISLDLVPGTDDHARKFDHLPDIRL